MWKDTDSFLTSQEMSDETEGGMLTYHNQIITPNPDKCTHLDLQTLINILHTHLLIKVCSPIPLPRKDQAEHK